MSMRNRFAGKCNLCEKHVPIKAGRWRETPKGAQNFTGLRCMACSTTTKKGKAATKKRLNLLTNKE